MRASLPPLAHARRLGLTSDGYTPRMTVDDQPPISVDEQLGSPGWTFEEGLLIGLSLGLGVLVVVGRRRSRRREDSGATP